MHTYGIFTMHCRGYKGEGKVGYMKIFNTIPLRYTTPSFQFQQRHPLLRQAPHWATMTIAIIGFLFVPGSFKLVGQN